MHLATYEVTFRGGPAGCGDERSKTYIVKVMGDDAHPADAMRSAETQLRRDVGPERVTGWTLDHVELVGEEETRGV